MTLSLTRTAGLAAAVAVLAGGTLATAAVAATESATMPQATTSAWSTSVVSQASVPALKPSQVKYVHRYWGNPNTELGFVIWAPKGWKMVKLSTYEAKFTSPNKLWNLRVNGLVSPEKPLKTMVDAKVAALRGTRNIKFISRVNGTTKATNPAFGDMTFHHTTLTYSYKNAAGKTRLVVDRFVAVSDATHTQVEISTGGRPQDKAGLNAITAKATEDYVRLP
jgi:hypothetical protein